MSPSGETISTLPLHLSTTLKRIESKNYIKRIPHPTDPRAYLVELTEQSIEIINILKDMPLRECEFEKLKQIEVSEESIE